MTNTLSRRDALKLAAAASACTPEPHPSAPSTMNPTATSPLVPSPLADNAVLRVKPLGFTWETPDPFLFCVHHDDHYPAGNAQLGPAASLDGRDLGQDFVTRDGWRMYHGRVVPGFPSHPHRGFETVTVVRHGMLDHSDSLGAAARYGGGDVQWLTAGAGIQHAEMFPLLDAHNPNPVELFQIWLNLPRADKFADAHFTMFWNESIPRHHALDEHGRATEVTVVAGAIGDKTPLAPPPRSWAARAASDLAIWTLKMQPGARFVLPAASAGVNRTLYFFRGNSLQIGSRAIPQYHGVELRADASVALTAGSDETEVLVLQGRPIGEPVVQHGPFVMNSTAEIQQAFRDYQRTRFGGWPWASDDPVHARDEGRFARFTDGRVDRPVRG